MSKHIFKYESEAAAQAGANERPANAPSVALAGILAKYYGVKPTKEAVIAYLMM